uniref:Uncharacterized protein n=1 Tax=Caenorhabditis japonica TaxID=281687 RepID=A0A8R1EFL7_CAEJA
MKIKFVFGFENSRTRTFPLTMLPALGCSYGGLSMACTTGNFWTKANLSRPSNTLPNCEKTGPSLNSPR